MYLGRYPDTNGLPPGYKGVAYSAAAEDDEQEECAEAEKDSQCDGCETICDSQCSGECETEPDAQPCCEMREDASCRKRRPSCGQDGLLSHLFSHKIDMEDLLIIGLILMLINSGSDPDLITMLALLFVMGL